MSFEEPQSFHDVNIVSLSPETLSAAEKRWVSFQPYLLSKGYDLRARYQPGWVPSWTKTGADPYGYEDSMKTYPLRVLDATRVEDQFQVIIKMVAPADDDKEGEEEIEILQHFSTEPFKNDPKNHVIPFLDSFPIPGVEGGMFYVMPLLRKYFKPPFYDLGDMNDFLLQLFEGLEFLHANDVAHCDIASPNILMDGRALYNEPFHPVHQNHSLDGKRLMDPKYLRSQRPVRYYYIDFGYAKWFHNMTAPRTITGSRAREQAPEQMAGDPYDPFKADIFQLGAILRRDLIPRYPSLTFLLPLSREMTERDPDQRPTLKQARESISTQFAGLSAFRKRWPIVPPGAPLKCRFMYIMAGVTTEVVIFMRRILRLIFFRA